MNSNCRLRQPDGLTDGGRSVGQGQRGRPPERQRRKIRAPRRGARSANPANVETGSAQPTTARTTRATTLASLQDAIPLTSPVPPSTPNDPPATVCQPSGLGAGTESTNLIPTPACDCTIRCPQLPLAPSEGERAGVRRPRAKSRIAPLNLVRTRSTASPSLCTIRDAVERVPTAPTRFMERGTARATAWTQLRIESPPTIRDAVERVPTAPTRFMERGTARATA